MIFEPRIDLHTSTLSEVDRALVDQLRRSTKKCIRSLANWAREYPDLAFRNEVEWITPDTGREIRVPDTRNLLYASLREDGDLRSSYNAALQALRDHPPTNSLIDRMVGLDLLGATRIQPHDFMYILLRRLILRVGTYSFSGHHFNHEVLSLLASVYREEFLACTYAILGPGLRSALRNSIALDRHLKISTLSPPRRLHLINAYPDFHPGRHGRPIGTLFLSYQWTVKRDIWDDERQQAPRSRESHPLMEANQAFRLFDECVNATFEGASGIVAIFTKTSDWLDQGSGMQFPDGGGSGANPVTIPPRRIRDCYRSAKSIPHLVQSRRTVEHLAFSRLARLAEKRSDQDALLDLVIAAELLFKSKRAAAVRKALPLTEMSNRKRIAATIVRMAGIKGSKIRPAEISLMEAYGLRNTIVHGDKKPGSDFFTKAVTLRKEIEPLVKAAMRAAIS